MPFLKGVVKAAIEFLESRSLLLNCVAKVTEQMSDLNAGLNKALIVLNKGPGRP
jgi:hypothetical protein